MSHDLCMNAVDRRILRDTFTPGISIAQVNIAERMHSMMWEMLPAGPSTRSCTASHIKSAPVKVGQSSGKQIDLKLVQRHKVFVRERMDPKASLQRRYLAVQNLHQSQALQSECIARPAEDYPSALPAPMLEQILCLRVRVCASLTLHFEFLVPPCATPNTVNTLCVCSTKYISGGHLQQHWTRDWLQQACAALLL